MEDIEPHLRQKLAQAKFFFESLKAFKDDAEKREYHLSAVLSSLRSIVLYVRAWLERQGRIRTRNDKEWTAILHAWENGLDADILPAWKCFTKLRNADTHEEPAIPEDDWKDLYLPEGFLPKGFLPQGYLPGMPVVNVSHPETNKKFDAIRMCEISIAIAEKLIDDHRSL